METKIDRSFPCLVFLAKRHSDPSHELQRTSEFDYVFFSPSVGLKQDDPKCTPARDRQKQSGALPKGRTDFSHSAGGLLSEGQSGGYPCSSDPSSSS
jgi:hypothetical protein